MIMKRTTLVLGLGAILAGGTIAMGQAPPPPDGARQAEGDQGSRGDQGQRNLGNVVSVANATDEVTEAARKANTVPAAGEVAAVVAGAAQAMVFLVDLQLASRDRSSAQIISRVIYP
jgi:hypothetical protein